MARQKKRFKLSKFELRIIRFCAILILLFPVISVFAKATLVKTNLEVERLKREINLQSKRNQSLVMKVNELKSFENIQIAIEEEGLAYNTNNIKVITKNQ